MGILKSVSDCLHFALSSPHIATSTPSHQHAPPPTVSVKRRNCLEGEGGGGGDRDLCLITLPLLGQLPQSWTVAIN